jgi:ABC-2 type transport system ATP-binding protein
MSILVENLTKLYGAQQAVNSISFKAETGVLGFLGPNGAGKSTTMKMLTGFVPQTSGLASVCGFDTVKQALEVKRHIGYLPESNPLYTDMYVKEALSFVAGIHKLHNPTQRIAEVIEQTGLQPEQHKKIGQLSKGYRQRVGIAQAILHNPEVLILDEPTSGLDPNQLIGIRQLIRDLGATKTVILSTHIMQEVEATCNRVIIINKGNIVANDDLQNLKGNYKGKSLEDIFISLTN